MIRVQVGRFLKKDWDGDFLIDVDWTDQKILIQSNDPKVTVVIDGRHFDYIARAFRRHLLGNKA